VSHSEVARSAESSRGRSDRFREDLLELESATERWYGECSVELDVPGLAEGSSTGKAESGGLDKGDKSSAASSIGVNEPEPE
jgi:hypothetical protein